NIPATPPTRGTRLTGIGSPPAIAFSAWIETKVASPVYTAWPKLSMPPWPSSMLNDRQATIAMPICDSIVIDRLLVNTSGATASTSTNRLQITKRPTLSGRKSKRAGAAEAADAVDTAAMRLGLDVGKALIASALPRSEQPLGPE